MTCSLISYLSNQSADSWTAIWTALLFFATVGLAIIAWVQIAAARRENRLTQTLIACGLYDTNQVIFSACQTIMKAKDAGTLERDAYSLRLEILTVLNFLDAIAIGVSQGMYVKELVKEHMSGIMARHVRELINSPVGAASGCNAEYYPRLLALNAEWSPQPKAEMENARPQELGPGVSPA